jgi:hypothetical protein
MPDVALPKPPAVITKPAPNMLPSAPAGSAERGLAEFRGILKAKRSTREFWGDRFLENAL